MLKENDWLDDKTKNIALIKLNEMKQNIGFADWMLNDNELDDVYNLVL